MLIEHNDRGTEDNNINDADPTTATLRSALGTPEMDFAIQSFHSNIAPLRWLLDRLEYRGATPPGVESCLIVLSIPGVSVRDWWIDKFSKTAMSHEGASWRRIKLARSAVDANKKAMLTRKVFPRGFRPMTYDDELDPHSTLGDVYDMFGEILGREGSRTSTTSTGVHSI